MHKKAELRTPATTGSPRDNLSLGTWTTVADIPDTVWKSTVVSY